jgi:hypothetical protein
MRAKNIEQIPAPILERLRKAGRARWEGVSQAERRAHGLRAWQAQLAHFRHNEMLVSGARALPT